MNKLFTKDQPSSFFIPRLIFVNFPQTTTILALGFMFGILFYTPLLAWIGTRIPPEYQEEVTKNGQLFRDGMLLILGFYFAKVVNAGQQAMVNRTIEVAQQSQSPTEQQTPPRQEGDYTRE